VWRGTLDALAAEGPMAEEIDMGAPGTIVVGDVVTIGMQATLDVAVACGS
jgi:hypothetical protein